MKALVLFLASLSLPAQAALTHGDRPSVRPMSADVVAHADRLTVDAPTVSRDFGELAAPWKAVALFSAHEPLFTHHEGGPFGEYWTTHPSFAAIEAQVADFIRFNQQSSLTPYEATALGRALSAGPAVAMWPKNGQLHTLDGAFTVGDRVNFVGKYDGPTTGIVIAVDGNRTQVLTADSERVFRSYEITRAQITRKVARALVDSSPVAP